MSKKIWLVFVLLILVSSFGFAVLNDAEVYYTFDDSDLSGSNPLDISGNSKDGTNVGATTGVGGIINQGFDFEKTDSDQVYRDDSDLEKIAGDSYSVSVWIKPESITTGVLCSAGNAIVVLGNSTSYLNNYLCIYNNSGTPTVTINRQEQNVANNEFSYGFNPPTDSFTHLVMTYNFTTGLHLLYINGNYVVNGTTTGSGTGGAISYGLEIGSGTKAVGSFFDGIIDEVSLYSRVITPSEISQLYASGNGYNPYTEPISNFTVTVENENDFNLTLNGTEYVTTTGTIITNIYNNDTSLWDFNITSYGYAPLSYEDYNVSSNLTINLSTAFTVNVTNVNTFSLDINGSTYSTTSGFLITNVSNQAGLFNLTVYSSGYVNRTFTNYNVSSNLTTTLFLNSTLNNVTFQEILSGTPLNGANVTVYYPNYTATLFTADANGTIFIPAVQNNTIQEGAYIFKVDAFGGYETPVNFTDTFNESQMPFNYNYNLTKVNITVNLFYRTNGDTFNKSTNIFIQGVGNITTSNGSYSFDVIGLASGDYVIQAFSSGYFTEQRTVTFFNQESLSVNLYLLENDLNTSNTLKVNVLDITQSKVDGATVNLLEYDTTTLSYKSISECYTDADGVCNFLVELNDKTYKYTASKTIGGTLLTASSGDEGVIFREDIAGGSAITFSQLEVTLVLQETETYTFLESHYLRYNITENFNSTTNKSSVIVDFQTTDGSDTTVCIEFTNVNTGASELQVCVDGSSGTVTPTTPFTLNRSITHKLEVYQIASDGSKTNLDTFYYNSDTSLQENLKNYAILSPFILALWVVIISVALYSGVLPILVVLGIILAVAEVILFPNYMIASGMVIKIIVLLQIFYFGRKKEDFN